MATLSRNILSITLVICIWVAIVTAQSQNITRTANPATSSQQRAFVTQRRRGNGGQRSDLVQLRRRQPQRRPVLNLQNLPRARSFQAGVPNMVPSRDPRTGLISRGISTRNQPSVRIVSGSRSPRGNINRNAMCAPPRSVRCYSWPRNRDSRGAYICDGGCQRRSCAVPCECSCVDPRLIGRLRAIGRISGPELIPTDTRLTDGGRRQLMRNRILAMRAARRRQLPVQPGASTNRGVGANVRPQRNTIVDLNFGISDDVLATLIAQPALNEIVGPQGINQIIAGEPPPLLSRESRGRSPLSPSISNEIPQPDIRAVRTPAPRAQLGPQRLNQLIAGESPTLLTRESRGRSSSSNEISQPDIRALRTPVSRAQQGTQLPVRDRGMGIPVPLSRLNFNPGTVMNPAMGNMRVVMSELRPFEEPTTGMNIDLPNPTRMNMNVPSAADNQISVRQLPGTSVLFVDLTRSSPTGQTGRMSQQRRILPINNMTSSDLRSRNRNNILISRTNQTLPGNIGTGGGVRTFLDGTGQEMRSRVRPPTQDECLAQRMELWCDPQKPWDGTPGLSRWCLLNCRADNCDNQRCACACIEEILFKTKYEQLSLRAP